MTAAQEVGHRQGRCGIPGRQVRLGAHLLGQHRGVAVPRHVGDEGHGPLHVAGGQAVSRAELAELVSGGPVTRVPTPVGEPTDVRLDCSRARSLLRTPLRGVRDLWGPAAG